MRSAIDFSSWQAIVSTLLGLVLVSVVAVGIRLLVMQGVQQRRERQNRQINERLKTLIAAYKKTLGGSFTGDLAVDPSHLRDALQRGTPVGGAERRRRVRDAVEAALADVILLGTEAQVRLAARAVNEMVAGRHVEIAELVVSLRDFIRDVLDLEAIPAGVTIPKQGPQRGAASSGKGGGPERSGRGGQGAGGAGGQGADGGGMGGMGMRHDDEADHDVASGLHGSP
jgi:heme exporter protein D